MIREKSTKRVLINEWQEIITTWVYDMIDKEVGIWIWVEHERYKHKRYERYEH